MLRTPIANTTSTRTKTTTTSVLAFRPRPLQVSLLSQSNPNPPPSMDQKPILLRSIARYLQRSGFSKTLKKLCTEAKIQKDDLDNPFFDLEEIFCKLLEKCDPSAKTFESNNLLDLLTDGISKRHGHIDVAAAGEAVGDRKTKKGAKSHDNPVGASGKVFYSKNANEMSTDNKLPIELKSEKNKRNKKNYDSVGQQELGTTEVLKEPANSPDQKSKIRKKKSKMDLESAVDNIGGHHLQSLLIAAEEKSKDVLLSDGKKLTDSETVNEPKDKKKKKKKPPSDPIVDSVEQQALDGKQGTDAVANENVKSRLKRKRKDNSASENLASEDREELDQGKSKIDSKKDDFEISKEDVTDKRNKGSKKRKRLPSEENDTQPAHGMAVEESKRRKTDASEESEVKKQSTKLNSSIGTDENAQDKESSKIGSIESQSADGLANGNLEDNGEKSTMQKIMKNQQRGSAETKSAKHFQRVKVDEVVFSDERLQDNSYWAKDGAENGYGAKAQEVLGQVKGRDFRHEKTKKKRGAYRGGQIDVQSHSIKFNYSDDD